MSSATVSFNKSKYIRWWGQLRQCALKPKDCSKNISHLWVCAADADVSMFPAVQKGKRCLAENGDRTNKSVEILNPQLSSQLRALISLTRKWQSNDGYVYIYIFFLYSLYILYMYVTSYIFKDVYNTNIFTYVHIILIESNHNPPPRSLWAQPWSSTF